MPNTGNDESAITPLVKRFGFDCAASAPFSPFSYLRYAYLQCRAIMSLSISDRTYPIFHFEDSYEEYVLASLDSTTSLKALCSSVILDLCQTEHGREFVHSLRMYLAYGRNISDAAKALYIHRNTLFYRIERLEELLGIDFKTADGEKLFQLQLSCIIAESGL